MGLSASQARLLTITSRLHDIEFKQQALSNTKMRFANETEEISQKYTQALSKQKLQFKNSATGQYQDMTVKSLYSAGSKYQLKNSKGQTVVPQSVYDAFQRVANSSQNTAAWYNGANHINNREGYLKDEFIMKMIGISGGKFEDIMDNYGIEYERDESNNAYIKGTEPKIYHWDHDKMWNYILDNKGANAGFTQQDLDYWNSLYSSLVDGSQKIDKTAQSCGGGQYTAYGMNNVVVIADNCLNNQNWLYEAIESGEFMLAGMSGKEINISSEMGIDMVSDKSDEAKAKAEYDAATSKINRKEKMIDNQMKMLDTEYSAVKTEFDSVKNIISSHAEKDFNLFG